MPQLLQLRQQPVVKHTPQLTAAVPQIVQQPFQRFDKIRQHLLCLAAHEKVTQNAVLRIMRLRALRHSPQQSRKLRTVQQTLALVQQQHPDAVEPIVSDCSLRHVQQNVGEMQAWQIARHFGKQQLLCLLRIELMQHFVSQGLQNAARRIYILRLTKMLCQKTRKAFILHRQHHILR